MIIKNATFVTSAASPKQFLKPSKPMIAICGKSNVGKSSLINKLANQRRLARTSADPGRTRLVNYFDFGEFLLADLPGYGYAKVSKAEKEKWAKTLEAFFAQKERLAHVLLLVDIRHDPTDDDEQMVKYLYCNAIPYTVVATKADKLSRMQQGIRADKIAGNLALTRQNILLTSAETGLGRDALLDKIEQILQTQALLRENPEDAESADDTKAGENECG